MLLAGPEPALCCNRAVTDIPDDVRLSTEGIIFTLADQTAGVVVVGAYRARTKDGLVQVVSSDGYQVGTGPLGPACRCLWGEGGVPRAVGMDTAGGVGRAQAGSRLPAVL